MNPWFEHSRLVDPLGVYKVPSGLKPKKWILNGRITLLNTPPKKKIQMLFAKKKMFPDVSSMLVLGQASGDDPVKDAAQKVQPLSRFSLTMLSCTKCPEILRRLWHHMREELKNDLAFTAVWGGNIAVAQTSYEARKERNTWLQLAHLVQAVCFLLQQNTNRMVKMSKQQPLLLSAPGCLPVAHQRRFP